MRPLLAVLCCAASPAFAHEADLIYAQLSRDGDGGVTQTLTLTGATLGLLAPVDLDGDGAVVQSELDQRGAALGAGVWDQAPLGALGGPCQRTGSRARLRPTYLELEAGFSCPPGGLTQTFRFLSILPSGYRVVLGTVGTGHQATRFASAHAPTLSLPEEEGPAQISLGGWVALGVEHIFRGWDHLAFLAGLLLTAFSWQRLLLLVTSFTAAHSLTLGLSTLHVVPLGERASQWVELAIAGSIALVAAGNLAQPAKEHRAWVTFIFGLVHGFGFASVLSAYGLGDRAGWALLGFNLGVELGQGLVVALLFPVLTLAFRRNPARRAFWVRVASGGLFGAGAILFVQRLLG